MRTLGLSTACYYPLTTELALEKTIQTGVKCCEVFFNSTTELERPFLTVLKDQTSRSGITIRSIHPFSSFAESFFLFSAYERRFRDTLDAYDRFFEAARYLGASIVVIHGIKKPGEINDEEYFERFAKLSERGAMSGLRVCQENVVNHRSEDPFFLARMARAIGGDFGVVLDIKQAKRAGQDPFLFVKLLGDRIAHVHLSDSDGEADCLPPGEGCFDFKGLFSSLNNAGYTGDYMVELYRSSYTKYVQIDNSLIYLKKCLI